VTQIAPSQGDDRSVRHWDYGSGWLTHQTGAC
jgi:hypothetical protein